MAQISYDPLTYGSPQLAKEQRDKMYRQMKREGAKVSRFVLRNQLQKYSSLGQPDGQVRDIYYIQVN